MDRLLLLVLASGLLAASALGQPQADLDSPQEARRALAAALAERSAAQARSDRFDRQAREAEDAAERAAGEAAALAARIQQAEAGISAARTRIAMIDRERAQLAEELGQEQGPVVRLTAALQQFTRRPVALAVLQPGSVKELVYVRALLQDAVPQVRARTSNLRRQMERSRDLRSKALAAGQVLQAEEQALLERRRELVDLETRQRLTARSAGNEASREADRALALAEQARDLDGLLGDLGQVQRLRDQLAALSGPLLRPTSPTAAQEGAAQEGGAQERGVAAALGDQVVPGLPPSQPAAMEPQGPAATPAATPAAMPGAAPQPYILPVAGRVITGYRAPVAAGLSNAITLAPIGGAQVVAPAAGRVAFAGPYRGYGQIVILEHAGGWTSVVTGLARADVAVGDVLAGGAPIGRAAPERPAISLELRRGQEPVNPLLHTR